MTQPSPAMRKLWGAVVDGRLEEIEEMLQKQEIQADASNSSGLQALHLAAKVGKVDVASLLLKHGAKVNAKSTKGNTALHTASLMGDVEMTKLLLSNGSEVNVFCACNNDTFTPLYMAAQGGHQEIVTLLLIHGADPLSKTQNGFTAHDIALQQGHLVIAELLEEYSKQKKHYEQLDPQHHNQQKIHNCWEETLKENFNEISVRPDQATDRNSRLPRLLHLLPQQRNRIRCSRSCDKMLLKNEMTRFHLHHDSNKLYNKVVVNKALAKVKAPSVSSHDFMQTPNNSPMKKKISD